MVKAMATGDRHSFSLIRNSKLLGEFLSQVSIISMPSQECLIIFSRPLSSAIFVTLRASSIASRDMVMRVFPSKGSIFGDPSLFLMFMILGTGQEVLCSSSLFHALGDRASMPTPGSPPRAFCHDQVTASNLFQGISRQNTALVASTIVIPSLSSEMKLS